MGQVVPDDRAVPLAIRKVFEDGRDGVLLRIVRQPDARGQVAAVLERDPGVLDLPDLAWELRNGFHCYCWLLPFLPCSLRELSLGIGPISAGCGVLLSIPAETRNGGTTGRACGELSDGPHAQRGMIASERGRPSTGRPKVPLDRESTR